MGRYLGDDFMLPAISPLTSPWFTSGALQIQFCNDCETAQHPPEDICRACFGNDLGFRELPGEGTVESAVVVDHPVHPALVDCCPYVVAVVSLDGAPGCNAVGNVLGCEPDEVAIGDRVRAVFEEATGPGGEALRIPQWERLA
jgi:uncharacterized OB-fold protein